MIPMTCMNRGHCHIKTLVLLGAALLLFLPLAARAGKPVVLDKDLAGINIGRHLEILEDPAGKWGIHDVVSDGLSRSFRQSQDEFPVFGFTRSAYWARFTVANKTGQEIGWYLEVGHPQIERINIFMMDREGRLTEERASGDILPFSSREVPYFNAVFSFTEPEMSSRTCYVRCQTKGAMDLFLTVWSPAAFREHAGRMEVIFAIYYGAMLVMIIYNLFLFLSLWDRSYLYYVLYCLAFVVFQLCMNGLAFQYLWPDFPWWAKHSIPFWVLLTSIFAVQFLRYFLDTMHYVPAVDRVLKISSLVFAAAIPLSFFTDYTATIITLLGVVMMMAIFLYVIAVKVLMLGNRAARMYIITWAAFWIGTLIYSLKLIGIIPDTFVTRWMLQISSLAQVILLSLALADKINFMNEKMETVNENLEGKVQERTRELNKALRLMERKDNEIQREFDLAGDIQHGLLPQTPFYHEGVKVVAYYKLMGKVGGDFYDIFQMKGGYLGVLIADVSGHGMPAAFITALAKISFAEAIQTSLFPADIFRHVNNELVKAIKTDDFVTAFFAVISPTRDIFYCNASHQMALVLRKDMMSIETWDTNGLFMGYSLDSNDMYEDGQNQLGYGDRILLYTDGIVGAQNSRGAAFGERRLERLFVETASLSLEDARDLIVRECQEHIGDTPQSDDMTLVMVEIDPAYRDLVEYRDEAFKLMWHQHYQNAIPLLSKALAINPKDEQSHLFIGECYLKNGDYARAVEHLSLYVKNNEFDANVWFNLAWAHYCLDDYPATLKYASRATNLKGNFVDAMMLTALSLKKTGERREAQKVFEKVLSIDPDNDLAELELRDIRNA